MPLYSLIGDDAAQKTVAVAIAIVMIILAVVTPNIWVTIGGFTVAAFLIWFAFGDILGPIGIKVFNLIYDAIERSAH